MSANPSSAGPAAPGRGPAPAKPTFGPAPPLESAGCAVSPTSAEVEQHILALQRQHPALVTVEAPRRTAEGRPIYAVTLTDPHAPAADQQHVLIVAGQHGNEESGRLVALALLDWLVSPEGAPTLAHQRIVVMPNVSPDAAEHDTYDTTEGIRPNLDHGPAGAWSPEGQALQAVARALEPEVFVDMHARGGAGWSYDMVLYPLTFPYLEDDNLLHQIAGEMAAAGEAAGIPHVTHSLTWPGWGNNGIGESSSTVFHYRNYHSLVFLTETAEHNREATPAALRKAAGLARLKALLAYGNRRHPRSYYAGYPYSFLGTNDSGFVAVGRTAAERRASRIALWTRREELERPKPAGPEPALRKQYRWACQRDFAAPLGVQVRCVGKMAVETVTLDGRELPASETAGYYSWQDGCSTFVVVAQPGAAAGEHEVRIQFQGPALRE